MSGHIQEFTIHSYRGIRNLELSELNSINILTGDNNSGKTSVLEVLASIDNPQDMGAWYLGARVANVRTSNKRLYNGFYNMFPIDEDEKKIAYSFLDEKNKRIEVEMTADISEVQVMEKEIYRLKGLMRTERGRAEEEIIDASCLTLNTFINEKHVNKYNIYDFQTVISRFVRKEISFYRTVYVSPVDYAKGDLYLEEMLSNVELYTEMINVLQEFDNNIVHVNAIKAKDNSGATEYMVLSKNHKNALPLNVYGDGMKKSLLLLSAVLKARDGILLLDEFETAIHTSAMDSVFSWLMKNARKYNVQVFLTSHSKEAIEKVLKSDKELQPYINLYTLYNYQGENLVRRMGCLEAINAKENLGLELR